MSLSSSNGKHVRYDQAVDLISDLPETILLRILCFVPTKSAAKTSVLSKRWENLWTKVPALDFTELPLSLKDFAFSSWAGGGLTREQLFYFLKFVDKALLLNDSSYLQHFRLHLPKYIFLGHDYHDLYVKSWLGSIRKRKCHEISIVTLDWKKNREYIHLRQQVHLPTKFLYNETLVILKLDGRFVLDVPFSFHLPNLKTIHLIHIRFSNDEFLRSISSGCPLLEELVIMSCRCISTLYVESGRLRSLKLKDNMKPFLRRIVIEAPNLRSLHLYDTSTEEYDICDMSLLDEADLYLKDKIFFQFLRKIYTVKNLSLRLDSLDNARPRKICLRLASSNDAWSAYVPIIPFRNLTSLKLHATHRILWIFLSCSPRLKSLTIDVPSMDLHDELDYNKFLSGLLPSIESVVLEHIKGLKEEVDLVEYFLKAGSIMKKMKMTYYPFELEEESYTYEKLSKLPKLSPHCQVELISEPW